MTSAPLHFEPIDDTGFVRVADIDLGTRLRPVDRVWAAALGKIMLKDGQETAITVCRLPGKDRWTLVAGAHRVVGAQIEEIEQLKATIIGPGQLVRRQSEISENLHRKDLDPVERAAFVAELVTVMKLRAGIDPAASAQSIAANARWQRVNQFQSVDASATIAHAYGWADDVALETGFSRRSIYNDLLIQSRLSPSIIERLRVHRHPILNNATQLRALAKLDEQTQFMVVGRMIDGGAKTVAAAQAILAQKPVLAPDAKRLSTFVGTFSRMGDVEKGAALTVLVSNMTPAMRRHVQSILNEADDD